MFVPLVGRVSVGINFSSLCIWILSFKPYLQMMDAFFWEQATDSTKRRLKYVFFYLHFSLFHKKWTSDNSLHNNKTVHMLIMYQFMIKNNFIWLFMIASVSRNFLAGLANFPTSPRLPLWLGEELYPDHLDTKLHHPPQDHRQVDTEDQTFDQMNSSDLFKVVHDHTKLNLVIQA